MVATGGRPRIIRFCIIRDNHSCHDVFPPKRIQAKYHTKSRPKFDGTFRVVNRIVVEELESWFFGDITAVRIAYPRFSSRKRPDSDAMRGGTWEALHREMQKVGYFKRRVFPKLEVARMIAVHRDPDVNGSPSFQMFQKGLDAYARRLCLRIRAA